ncbi:family 1 glycosylhydrolase [Nocardioides sp. TRM66260-LWL]|uniref:glycoside hydrolase family 1 protein n=1 Tax=Nocardioides sp. TRM66260-LWL TaxID=2874478 RepID=UPI001CC53F58|nr:family 1 glycosylhydrolase [Nocardioides sp. TRM66260-LWL]MBZ5735453.1 family 1 glycosylhydrolase [Nocardioides sp. TRM66260-LWL]
MRSLTPAPAAPPVLPPGFRLGVATAAWPTEGAADARGATGWDRFAALPGTIRDAATGDPAAHGVERWREDVDLLARLGVPAYRFSVSWARVQPGGAGPLSAAGLDHYERLVDALLAAGVDPMVTLHQWDLPAELDERGGWLDRDVIDRFAAYAEAVAGRLGDRVRQWVPVDQPSLEATLGYGVGSHAPGRALGFDALYAAHHLLLAHGRATMAVRSRLPGGLGEVGCANQHAPVWPVSDDAADVGASKLFDALWNGLFLEPMLLGRYPADLAPLLEDVVQDGDLATIRQPLDFYGVTYAAPLRIGAAPEDSDLPFEAFETVGHPLTDAGWPVVPEALREWLIMLRARYRAALPPIVVTGTGAAFDDGPDGSDADRIAFLDAHLRAVAEAAQRGVDVRALYVWSLLDGVEWTAGRTHRFGLVAVDPDDGTRTPKPSFDWLASVVRAQTRSVG